MPGGGKPKKERSLADVLGHRFENQTLLREALCHPSAANPDSPAAYGYERMEFLGDRVLGLVMADLLFHAYPDEDEGKLSRRFTALVRRETLLEVAEAVGLAEHLSFSIGEDAAGLRANPAILADSCESVIGALYLDGGLPAARRFIERWWVPLMDSHVKPPKDSKTALQEWVQGRGEPLPVYETLASDGPAHEPEFTVQVTIAGFAPATATGPTKRAAEQSAAEALLEAVRRHDR